MPVIAALRRIYEVIGLVTLIGLALSILALLLFANIAENVAENDAIVQIDLALANDLYSRMIANPGAVQSWRFISLFGFQVLYVLGIAVALILIIRRRYVYLTVWAIALLGGLALNHLIKIVFARPRPIFTDPIALEQSFSFPSGHSMLSFIAYGMAAYLLWRIVRNPTARILIVFNAVMAIVLIGISRMFLGVHYLSDVVGGFTAGAVWLGACITAARVYEGRAAWYIRRKEQTIS